MVNIMFFFLLGFLIIWLLFNFFKWVIICWIKIFGVDVLVVIFMVFILLN